MRSAVSPVASLMIITVFMVSTGPRSAGLLSSRAVYSTHPRAFGIRSRGIAAHVRAHDLAPAATQRMVLARRARLGGVPPRAEGTESVGLRPVRRQIGHGRPLPELDQRWRGRKATRGDPAVGLRADQEVAARAAVDAQLGEQRAVRPVV